MSQKSHIIVLDSKDRLNPQYSNSNDCRLYIKPAVKGFWKVELLSFSMPLTQYNITATNNQVYFNIGGTNYTASIPVGSYDICTLCSVLKYVMNQVSGQEFDIWADKGLFRIVFTLDTNFSFTWGTNTSNSAAGILGFNNFNTSVATTIQSTNAFNLSLPLVFYVDILQFGTHVRSTKDGDFATWVIPTTGNSGGINQFNMFSHYQILEMYQQTPLSQIDVRIKTVGNQLLDLNNSDWVMVLRLHYEGAKTDGAI